MRLPQAERAYVARSKITDYLLSDEHPVGHHKARLFRSMGFTVHHPEVLADALLQLAVHGRVVDAIDSAFGRRYVVDGTLRGRHGSAVIRSVWIIAKGDTEPQFVTAFPRPRNRRRWKP